MNSTFNARFQLKRDLKAEWEKNDPVLLNGEMVIVDMPDGTRKTKTGDGTNPYSKLPFDGAVEYSKYVSATLLASAWTGSTQRVSVPELLAGGNGFITIPQTATAEQYTEAVLAKLRIEKQEDGFLTIAADGNIPQKDIPLSLVLLASTQEG